MAGKQIAKDIHEEFLRKISEQDDIPRNVIQKLRGLLESEEPLTELQLLDVLQKSSARIDEN